MSRKYYGFVMDDLHSFPLFASFSGVLGFKTLRIKNFDAIVLFFHGSVNTR